MVSWLPRFRFGSEKFLFNLKNKKHIVSFEFMRENIFVELPLSNFHPQFWILIKPLISYSMNDVNLKHRWIYL